MHNKTMAQNNKMKAEILEQIGKVSLKAAGLRARSLPMSHGTKKQHPSKATAFGHVSKLPTAASMLPLFYIFDSSVQLALKSYSEQGVH